MSQHLRPLIDAMLKVLAHLDAQGGGGHSQVFLQALEVRDAIDATSVANAGQTVDQLAARVAAVLQQPDRDWYERERRERCARLSVLLAMRPGETEAAAKKRLEDEAAASRAIDIARVRESLVEFSRDLQSKGLTVVETSQLLEAVCDDLPRREILSLVSETFEQVSANSRSEPSLSVTGHG